MAFVDHYFFFDTETSGNKCTEDDIISFAGILCKYENGKFHPVDEFNSFVSTNKKIDPAAQAIHKISKSDLRGAPCFPDVMRAVRGFLQEHQPQSNARLFLVGHNISKFDNIILYCNFVQHRMDFDQFLKDIKCSGFLDTLKYLRTLFKNCAYKDAPKDAATGKVSYALGHCYKSFCGAEELEGAHDALIDSRAMLDVVNSAPVCGRISLQNLFKNIVKKKKEVSWIKQTAGVAFQNREDHTRTMKAQDAEIEKNAHKESIGNDADDDADKIGEKGQEGPIFEEDFEGNSPDHRLCLMCMKFIMKNVEHAQCELEPKPFQRKSYNPNRESDAMEY